MSHGRPRKVVEFMGSEAQTKVASEQHEQQNHEQHESEGVADAVANGRAKEREQQPHEQHEQQQVDDGHGPKPTMLVEPGGAK